jgi:hypothetical protein
MKREITPAMRDMARAAVQAKIDWWEALRALEQATMPPNEPSWDDDVNDAVIGEIDMLAQADNSTAQFISDDDIDHLLLVAMGEEP